jgi:hypothetical protein
MLRASAWILLTAVAAIAQPVIAKPPLTGKDCKLKRDASVELKLIGNEILIPVAIENKPALMLLNISSAATVMWEPSAREFGLTPRPVAVSAQVFFGKKSITKYASTRSLDLGRIRFSAGQILLTAAPESLPRTLDEVPIVGAIGMDFFAHRDFELDFKNRRLTLYSQDHCPGHVVYWTNDYAFAPLRRAPLGNFHFPMELEGKKIETTLATGNAFTTLTTDVTKRLYGFDEHSEDIETEQEADGHTRSHYRAMALTTPGLQVTNSKVELIPRPDPCHLDIGWGRDPVAQYSGCIGGEAPLRLGMNVLQKLHLYFATKESVMYFSAADAAWPPSQDAAPSTP